MAGHLLAQLHPVPGHPYCALSKIGTVYHRYVDVVRNKAKVKLSHLVNDARRCHSEAEPNSTHDAMSLERQPVTIAWRQQFKHRALAVVPVLAEVEVRLW
jgi:hypothetical protein